MKDINVGVVGATGKVGETFLKLLVERQFPVGDLRLFASPKSLGKQIQFNGKAYALKVLEEDCFDGLDVVFFSSGDPISLQWAPKAVAAGAYAVDNSSAFRMNSSYPLVVPEINGDILAKTNQATIIANPNCSTIQMVMVLYPLLREFGLSQVNVATYQAVSGAGKPAEEELLSQLAVPPGQPVSKGEIFPHPIANNCLPQIGSFKDKGYCTEEIKMIRETKKILNQEDLLVSAFTVRVPVLNSHSEALWVKLKREVSQTEIMAALQTMPGLKLVPQNEPEDYPTARAATGEGDVFVGRIHPDWDDPKTWLMWVVADNILKGAALNGIQIAEKIFGLTK